MLKASEQLELRLRVVSYGILDSHLSLSGGDPWVELGQR